MQCTARYSQPVLERQLRRNITTATEVCVHVFKCTSDSHFPVSGACACACACACELTLTSFEPGEGADGDEGGGRGSTSTRKSTVTRGGDDAEEEEEEEVYVNECTAMHAMQSQPVPKDSQGGTSPSPPPPPSPPHDPTRTTAWMVLRAKWMLYVHESHY
jgi:hypothetical protein